VSDQLPVTYEVTDGVALVTLNRPEKRNAWNLAMEEAYFGSLERATTSRDVRAIVVTGSGTTFCPGLDTGVLDELSAGSQYSADRRPQTFAVTVPKPIVVAINGACAGIGFLQSLFCDIRFAVPEAKFTTAFSRRGLPAEDGAAWVLGRLIGQSRALDLLLSARVFLSEEALELGVINRIVEPEHLVEESVAYASMLASDVAPSAMAMIKRQVYDGLESSLEESRVLAQELIVEAKTGTDYREGVTSYIERRPAEFRPYPPEA
jgi:enoyl-CoA hydratase/carnithine racemase